MSKGTIVQMITECEALEEVDTSKSKADIIEILENNGVSPSTVWELGSKAKTKGCKSNKKQEKPQPQEKSEHIEEFIERFETWALAVALPTEQWLEYLWGGVNAEAGSALAKMSKADCNNFAKTKEFLLRQFKVTRESYLKRFREERKTKEESYLKFGTRLKHLLLKFLDLEEPEYEASMKVVNPMVVEQLLKNTSVSMAQAVKRKMDDQWDNLTLIIKILDEESSLEENGQGDYQNSNQGVIRRYHGERGRSMGAGEEVKREPTVCFRCNTMGHIASWCPEARCFRCGKEGHMAKVCKGQENTGREVRRLDCTSQEK